MVKTFNTTGICIPRKHYMVDTTNKINSIVSDMVAAGKYFTINRARQYGKTTTLFLLELKLQDDYIVVRISFEAAVNLLIKEKNTLFDDMAKKLKEYPALRNVIYSILFSGRSFPYHAEEALNNQTYDAGLQMNKGYMISFNFNKNKVVGMQELHFEDKTIVEVVV